MKIMTDENFNEQARRALAMADRHELNGLSSSIYKDDKVVRLYDGNGDYVYDFYVNEGRIRYKLKTDYKMEDLTKKMALRFIRRDNSFIIVFVVIISALFALTMFGKHESANLQNGKDSAKQKFANEAQKQQDTNKIFLLNDTLQKTK